MGVNWCKSLWNQHKLQEGKSDHDRSIRFTFVSINFNQFSLPNLNFHRTQHNLKDSLKYWKNAKHHLSCHDAAPKQWMCRSGIKQPHYIIHTSNNTSPQCCRTEITQLTCCQRMKVINPGESKCIIKMQILWALYKSKRIISISPVIKKVPLILHPLQKLQWLFNIRLCERTVDLRKPCLCWIYMYFLSIWAYLSPFWVTC